MSIDQSLSKLFVHVSADLSVGRAYRQSIQLRTVVDFDAAQEPYTDLVSLGADGAGPQRPNGTDIAFAAQVTKNKHITVGENLANERSHRGLVCL